jgi:putative transposase
MLCPHCQSTATVERPDRTELGYRRFRYRDCRRGFNERTGTPFNRLQYPTDVICLVVLWRFRYKLSLRDLAEVFLQRGLIFTHEAVREWEVTLAPLLSEALRKRRQGAVGNSWYVDETYLRVRGAGAICIVPSTGMAISLTHGSATHGIWRQLRPSSARRGR